MHGERSCGLSVFLTTDVGFSEPYFNDSMYNYIRMPRGYEFSRRKYDNTNHDTCPGIIVWMDYSDV